MLFSGGFSLFALALLHRRIDARKVAAKGGLRGWRVIFVPALVFGSYAILGFTLAQMLNPLFAMVAISGEKPWCVAFQRFAFMRFRGFLIRGMLRWRMRLGLCC